MKPSVAACLFLTVFLGACTRPEPFPEKNAGTLVLHLDSLATRAGYTTVETWEKRLRQYNGDGTLIAGVQILIYDSQGILEYNKMCKYDESAEMTLSTGKKYIYILSGCDRLGKTKRDDLRAFLTRLENTRGRFLPMRWYGTVTVGSEPVSVSATMKRTVARVAVTSLQNNLRSHQGVDSSFAFIGRARVKMDVAMNGTSTDRGLVNTDWSSGMTLSQARETSDLTGINLGSVAYGSSLQGLPKCLYSYPSTDLSENELPSLVIAAKIVGTWYYGEIPLGALKANNTYSVDITLQETGPEFPTQIVVSYTIKKWLTGSTTTVNY